MHTLSTPHNNRLKACLPKDFKTLTRMMLCSDVDDVDDAAATPLNASRSERDGKFIYYYYNVGLKNEN